MLKKLLRTLNWWLVTLSFIVFLALEVAVVYYLLKHFRVIS
jgi:hypothetical protein